MLILGTEVLGWEALARGLQWITQPKSLPSLIFFFLLFFQQVTEPAGIGYHSGELMNCGWTRSLDKAGSNPDFQGNIRRPVGSPSKRWFWSIMKVL